MKKGQWFKNLFRKDRFWKYLWVNLRWALRRLRRRLRREKLRSSFARRVVLAAVALCVVGGLIVGSSLLCRSFLADEAVLVRRLSDPDFNRSNPVLSALHCFGSTNRIQVTVTTDSIKNLKPQAVHLTRGNVNLAMTLKDGSRMEYTLKNRNMDTFESGHTDQFTLILPETVSAFDIAEYKLSILPDAKGQYGTWRCRNVEISFLLGGERTLLAQKEWEGVMTFSKESPASVLQVVSTENDYYNQINELYPYVLEICQNDHTTVHESLMKYKALRSLGMGDGNMLYLDIETVGLEAQSQLLRDQSGKVSFEETDLFDYDGTMTLRVQFYSDAGGSYVKEYPLDTPGKDDFELGCTTQFALAMPEGMSAFDIRSMELLVEDSADAWAPRLIRAYLRTDYGFMLELARETDVTLGEKRGTAVFYQGLIDTAISGVDLDLTATYRLPDALKATIDSQFIADVSGVTYSMYFNEFNFYERQKLFYSQMLALYGGQSHEA